MRHLLRALLALLLLSSPPARSAPESPWLGVEIEKTSDGSGARITDILPESPLAGNPAINRGDTITAVDGTAIQSPTELVTKVRTLQIGQRVQLGLRNERGLERAVTVLLGRRLSTGELQAKLVDKPAPEFSAVVVMGEALPSPSKGVLASLRGKPVLLDFFATWCGPCLESIPHLTQVQQRFKSAGLRVIGLSDEDPGLIKGVMGRYEPGYTLAQDVDRQAYRAYRITSYPTLVLIDGSGTVRTFARGNLAAIDQALNDLLGAAGRRPGDLAKRTPQQTPERP
jgi:thiol-disulfide isomerase/thioredoxin